MKFNARLRGYGGKRSILPIVTAYQIPTQGLKIGLSTPWEMSKNIPI
jgi:hypothetical protein